MRCFGLAFGAGLAFLTIPAGRADVVIELVESGSDVIAYANGSLNLPASAGSTFCGSMQGQNPNGAIDPALGAICVGPSGMGGFSYTVAGTMTFGSQMGTPATSSSGTFFGVNGKQMLLGSPTGAAGLLTVNGQSTFSGKTLTDLGVGLGVLGTWTLEDPAGGGPQTITLKATPGPLAALGIPVAFGWTRTLRRRIQEGQTPS